MLKRQARSSCRSQKYSKLMGMEHFWKFRCRFARHGQWLRAPCQKRTKRQGFVAFSKTMAGMGDLKRIRKDRCTLPGRGNTRDMFIRDVRKSQQRCPETGCFLEHQIVGFAQLILRDRHSISYDLISFVRGRRSTLDRFESSLAE